MAYYKDLSKVSLDDYKKMIINNYLIPSFRVLREDIEKRFEILKENNIHNMDELRLILKNKKNDLIISKKFGIPEKYIIVLRREINSHIPPERKLEDYITIDIKTKQTLFNLGINTSKDLYDYFSKINDINKLCKELNEKEETVIHLAKLSDLTRLRYVSALFATTLALTKYDTVEKVRNAECEDLYNQIIKVNKENNLFKGNIGLNDVKFLIQDTKDVIKDISFI